MYRISELKLQGNSPHVLVLIVSSPSLGPGPANGLMKLKLTTTKRIQLLVSI